MSDTDTEEEYFPSIGIAAPDSSDASDPSDEPGGYSSNENFLL